MNKREFGLEQFNDEQFLVGGVTLLLTGFIGMLGNLLVLTTTYRILRHKRNIPNVLILFLAWIDLLVFPLAYPQPLVKYFYGVYVGDYMGCDFQATCIVCLFTLSILVVVLMSVDRLLALFKPFYYDKQMIYDKEKIKIASIGFGCSVLTISLLPAFGVGRNVLHFPGTFCLFEWGSDSFEGQALVYIFMALLALAMLVVVVCNLATIFMALRLNQRTQNCCSCHRGDAETAKTNHTVSETKFVSGKMELQFAKLSGSVAVTFMSCWGLFLVRVTLIHSGWPFDELLDFTAVRLASLHPVINPWLYPLTRRKYRDAFCYLMNLSAYYVTCSLITRPNTTLDEIVGAQSEASQIREWCLEERRRSSAQRLVK
ncbi:prostaglandin E2 receptor EP3 subtype-like [Montipora capricornis]|uniref:prostaglandin E2 receptor EP3 subtype-like n=1 Tax=Montipora capricornis TaxID=246305 RepID=UPI0035F12BE8